MKTKVTLLQKQVRCGRLQERLRGKFPDGAARLHCLPRAASGPISHWSSPSALLSNSGCRVNFPMEQLVSTAFAELIEVIDLQKVQQCQPLLLSWKWRWGCTSQDGALDCRSQKARRRPLEHEQHPSAPKSGVIGPIAWVRLTYTGTCKRW
jgi:hypothetical protein